MTRPRAADDFAAIHARLAELRREREQASKRDTSPDDDAGPGGRDRLSTAETRQRGERSGWLTVSSGRRYGPGRQR